MSRCCHWIVSICLIALLAACGSTANEAGIERRITYGLTLIPSGIDPHIHSSTELGIVLRQVYDTLIYRHPDTLEFTPGLATAWTISDDGLNYTFNLRENVTFHDGTPFNAQAVAANLDRITEPATGSQRAAAMLGSYAGYTIRDDYTIELNLSEPFAPLLDSLAQVYLSIASPSALADYSVNRYQFHQVGTGPFRFIEYLPGDRIVLRRNADYAWGPSFYERGPTDEGIVEEIVFRFYVDESTRRIALENDEAQIMGELLPSDARVIAANNQYQLIPTEVPGQPAQFMFNTELPPTDNPAVRQALLYATNRAAIVDTVYEGFSPIAWGPIAASTRFFTMSVVNNYTFDAERAVDILTSAGFSDNDGNGILDFNGDDLELVMIVPNWGRLPQVAQLIQEQWRQIGVRLVLEPVPGFNALIDRVSSVPYHLVSFDTPGIDPVMLNQYFITDASRNWMNYSNPQLDAALRAAAIEPDPVVRRGLYVQVQEFIMSEALILPIRDYVNLNAASARIQNLRFDAYGWFPILNDITVSE
ncbi:hypothetical protein HC928_08845 [bacterium]|nr:hypothetical protein [bacterium]